MYVGHCGSMLDAATRKAAGGGRVGVENRYLLGNNRQGRNPPDTPAIKLWQKGAVTPTNKTP